MDESLDSCSTSQLLAFIRGVDEDMNITQELASLNDMVGNVTGENIFNELKKTFACFNLDWTNLCYLTVDGGKYKRKAWLDKRMRKTFYNQCSCAVLFTSKLCVLNM
jgi:hypothetical protein